MQLSPPHLSLSDSNEKSYWAMRDSLSKVQHEHVFPSCEDRQTHICSLYPTAPGKHIYLIAAPNRYSAQWLICLRARSAPPRSSVVGKPITVHVKGRTEQRDTNAVLIPRRGSAPKGCCSRCMGALQLQPKGVQFVCLNLFYVHWRLFLAVLMCIFFLRLDSLINLFLF